MGIAQRISDAYNAFRGRQTSVRQEISNTRFSLSPLMSTYENLFAQVQPLINRMDVVVPYGKGANGAKKPLMQTPELAVLINHPNDEMGWAEFAGLMFATWLTEPELNIHVWKNGRGRVTGYTILPAGVRRDYNSNCFYTTDADNKLVTISADEVMTLRFSRSPRDPQRGVSPASSVIVWTQLDDLVAQYERAFFVNGAVPATITFIRASTSEGFDAKRKELENGLKGSKNRNKTVYAWRQQLDDGSTGDEIEVKSIQGNNSTLDIKNLVSIIDARLRHSIGVSPFLMGDDGSAKYDNAELSERDFMQYRVHPALVKFWSQFQHELDRVTGGVGYSIDFDLELPELTDRLKVKAEISKTQTETLVTLIKAGASPAAAVDALELSDRWNKAANDISAQIEASAISASVSPLSVNQTGGEEEVIPDVPGIEQDTIKPKVTTTDALEDPMEYELMFEEGEELEKEAYDALMDLAKQVAEDKPNINLDAVKLIVLGTLLNRAKDGATLADEAVIKQVGQDNIVGEVGAMIKNQTFEFSGPMQQALKRRVSEVVDAYEGLTKDIVKKTLEDGASQGWSQAKLQKELNKALPRRQAELVARNEVHAGLNFGRYDEDMRLAEKYGLKLKLVWHANPGACDICSAMSGTEVAAGEAFPDHAHYHTEDGEDIEVSWKHSVYNADGRITNPHPNCRCTFDEVYEL